jgi:hypothetical protein
MASHPCVEATCATLPALAAAGVTFFALVHGRIVWAACGAAAMVDLLNATLGLLFLTDPLAGIAVSVRIVRG